MSSLANCLPATSYESKHFSTNSTFLLIQLRIIFEEKKLSIIDRSGNENTGSKDTATTSASTVLILSLFFIFYSVSKAEALAQAMMSQSFFLLPSLS